MTERNGQADVLRQAADELDGQWRADAERGLRDSFGGCEYQGESIAPRLRNMADKIDAGVLRGARERLQHLAKTNPAALRAARERVLPQLQGKRA
jgi:hypothetical protein